MAEIIMKISADQFYALDLLQHYAISQGVEIDELTMIQDPEMTLTVAAIAKKKYVYIGEIEWDGTTHYAF